MIELRTLQGKSSYILTINSLHLLFSHGVLIAVKDKSATVFTLKQFTRAAMHEHLKLFVEPGNKVSIMPKSWFNEITVTLPVKQ